MPARTLWLFDTFEGFDARDLAHEARGADGFRFDDTSLDAVLRHVGGGERVRACKGRFPDTAAQRTHASHSVFAPGPWGPGTCTGCHMPRSGVDVRLDAVSLTGELHSHALLPFDPDDVLVEFDLVDDDHLLAGEVPTGGCLDCHHQVDAERRDQGSACACPQGDPLYRVTWENLGTVYDTLWGAP